MKESGQQLLAELAIQHERGLVMLLKNIRSMKSYFFIPGKDTGAAADGPEAQHGIVIRLGERGRE